MALVIDADECTACGVCEAECPREAISEGDDVFEIDPDLCTECKEEGDPMCVAVCPVDCIAKPE